MKLKFLVMSLVVLVVGLSVFCSAGLSDSEEGFEVDAILLKTVIKAQGSFDGRQIEVTNRDDVSREFSFSFSEFEGLAESNLDSFELGSGESKNVEVVFSNKGNLSAGVSVGCLEVSSGGVVKKIPIILEMESEEVIFDSNIELFPKSGIFSGTELVVEIKIFDLSRAGTANVELEYFIKDFDKRTIVSKKESLVVDNQVSISKTVRLPEDIREGNYVFGVILKYKNSVGTASTFFSVDEEKFWKDLFKGGNFFAFFMFGVIILLLLIFLFYVVYSRDKLLDELRGQYKRELRRQDEYVSAKEKEVGAKLKTGRDRAISKKIFRKVRDERRNILRAVHRERKEKLKSLKKRGKKSMMAMQIVKWGKQGYDTSIFEKRAKMPTINGVQNQIRVWKKRGYDTKVLERK